MKAAIIIVLVIYAALCYYSSGWVGVALVVGVIMLSVLISSFFKS